MAFRNRVRLPFYISRAQFPSERNITRLAEGTTRVQSVVMRKTYEGKTDDLPEWVHQRLAIALIHDIVKVEGDRYFGNVAIDSEYEIDWPDFMDKPLGPANFKVQVTPFDATNSNCQSCEEANQVILVDDTFPDTLAESETYTLSLFDNDTINCLPYIANVVTYNADYISSVDLSAVGVLTIVTTAEFQSANGMKLLTYRVACPNGGYDEADVYANMDGSVDACLAPTNIQALSIQQDSVEMRWDDPDPVPAGGYEWFLIEADNPGVTEDSGISPDNILPISGLTPGTDYVFAVRSICGEDYYSPYVNKTFTTDEVTQGCGKYQVTYSGGGLNEQSQAVNYIHCSGQTRNILLFAFQPKTICAAELSEGNPVMIVGADNINYIGPC